MAVVYFHILMLMSNWHNEEFDVHFI